MFLDKNKTHKNICIVGILVRQKHPKHSRNWVRDMIRDMMGKTKYYPETGYLKVNAFYHNEKQKKDYLVLSITSRSMKHFEGVGTGDEVTILATYKPWAHNGLGGDITRIKLLKVNKQVEVEDAETQSLS